MVSTKQRELLIRMGYKRRRIGESITIWMFRKTYPSRNAFIELAISECEAEQFTEKYHNIRLSYYEREYFKVSRRVWEAVNYEGGFS